MRRFVNVLAIFCLTPAITVYSQNTLPPNGQSGEQPQQQARQAFGQQPGTGFSNVPANAATGAAGDPAYLQ
jgi:hypothetical protein